MNARRGLGKAGLEALRAALGGPAAPWTLESAWLDGASVGLAVADGPVLLEGELRPGPGGAARLSLRGEDPRRAQAERALSPRVPFAVLFARLASDCLLYSDPRGGGAESRFESYFRAVDHSAAFWRSLHPQARFLEQEVGFGTRYAKVSHATLECRLNNPQLCVAPLRFFADEPPPRSTGDDCSYADTTVGEADVVGGRTQALLGAALERVAREEKPAFIHLKTTCLPELLGDDPRSVIARLEKDGVPVLWTSKTRDPGPAYAALLDKMLARADWSRPRDPDAAVLAGVPSPEAGREAADLLAGLGLRVVGALFPDLDPARAPELGAASSVVWLDPAGWEKIDDAMFLSRGLAVVRHHPPYGLAGTRRWLDRVAAVLGRGGAAEAFEKARAARADALARTARACRGRRAVLFGSRAEVELLTAPGRAFGFSVAGLLTELGFDARVLVHAPDAASRREIRRAKAPSGAGSIEFVPFGTRAELDRALSRADLAFTHFQHDPRLEAHGVPGFTERAFAPGLDGLLRTGRTLARRCAARPFPGRRGDLTPWI